MQFSTNTNKSYDRHYHWKNLHLEAHAAKLCLNTVFNNWSKAALNNTRNSTFSLFDTHLTPIPKTNERDLSLLKSWQPISIETSENWMLEKIFLERLTPFIVTDNCAFGYRAY